MKAALGPIATLIAGHSGNASHRLAGHFHLHRSRRVNFIGRPRESFIRMSVSQAEFRKALSSFATGITVITLDSDGEVHGMTANAFASVSLDPMLVLVCVDQRARTHAHLHAKKRFGVNVLAENQKKISEYYARPARAHDRAAEEAGARFERTRHGTPVLQGGLAYLECRLHTAQDAGDHTIFIAEVEEVVVRDGTPLLFFGSQYRKLGENV
jgi:flavin reductase (DIM6/NTAB) family NADH-FMN oxidoreductase RutF